MIFMKLILGLIIIFVICIVFILISDYLKEQQEYKSSIPVKSDAVGITFNQFYNWYQLNPKRWTLLNDSVRIVTKPSKRWYDEDIFKVCYFNSSKEWKNIKNLKKI